MFPVYNTLRSRRFPIVNWMLILLNGMVFYYELKLNEAGLYRFILTWGLTPFRLTSNPSEAWITIFTSMFMHGGWFHLLSNMWFLAIFGNNIEERMGGARYLLFYLMSGIAAGVVQVSLNHTSIQPIIGASGAIAGIFGAFLMLFPYARIASLAPIFFTFTLVEVPAIFFLGFWFILQLFSGWLALQGTGLSEVAWWAHIGGFIFGMLTVNLFTRKPDIQS